ncbi:MAG: class I SAM-dependent methyltransferase [Acidobacteriota bacterium]
MKLALLLLAIASLIAAQVATKANERYRTPEGRAQLAAGMGSHFRDQEQNPRKLVAALDIKPGMTVADIGTGPGYMLPFLSAAAGPRGRVIAEDIFADMLEHAKKRIADRKLGNVTVVLGTATDPKLPEAAIDLAFTLEVYHHFDYPAEMLAKIRRALREDGRLAIVDFYRSEAAMPGGHALQHIRADQPEVIREVEANGFRLAGKQDHIPGRQYLLLFRKAPK